MYKVQEVLSPTVPRIAADLLRSVEQFLYYEAWCMDENRYDDWLALWAPELAYWVPCNNEDNEPKQMVSIIHDNRTQIEQRLLRLKGRAAYAQQPRSRMVRVVSNVVILSDNVESTMVTSSFTLGEIRSGNQEIYLGRSVHVLNKCDGQFRMSEKKVLLLNNDAPLGNLTFLI